MNHEFDVSNEALLALLGKNKSLKLKTFGCQIAYDGEPKGGNFDDEVSNFLEDKIPEKIQTIPAGDKITIFIWYTEKD